MYFNFQYKTTNISYRKLGAGKVVVLLHGFGEDSNIFNEQIDFLKNHCQLIVPDLPGSGKSEMLMNENCVEPTVNNKILPQKYQASIDSYANCIYELLNYENVKECVLLGHSMGGYIALSFAEQFADKLSAFGLIHSTAFADSNEKKENRKKGIELVDNYGAYSFLKNTIPTLFGKSFKELHSNAVDALIEAAKQFKKESVQQYLFAMMNRPDRTSVLNGCSLPVLFIIGTEDAAAPMADVLKQVHLPKKSYIHVLNHIGHMSMLEATDLLNKHILDFITS